MALPQSGIISYRDINSELKRTITDRLDMTKDAAARALAGVSRGSISLSDFYGKQFHREVVISSNIYNLNLREVYDSIYNDVSSIVNFIVTGTIGSDEVGEYALVSGDWPDADEVNLTVTGAVIGIGGVAGTGSASKNGASATNGGDGGDAIYWAVNGKVKTLGNGTIAGAGGGGGGAGARVRDTHWIFGDTYDIVSTRGGGGAGNTSGAGASIYIGGNSLTDKEGGAKAVGGKGGDLGEDGNDSTASATGGNYRSAATAKGGKAGNAIVVKSSKAPNFSSSGNLIGAVKHV